MLDLVCVRVIAAERRTEWHDMGGQGGISVSCEGCGM